MFSICRDHKCFYAHVVYNVRSAYADILAYTDKLENDKDAISKLSSAEENAKSALTKLQLVEKFNDTLEIIDKKFGYVVEFIKIVESLKRNYEEFPTDFQPILIRLRKIAQLEFITTKLAFYFNTENWTHIYQLENINAFDILKSFGISNRLAIKEIKDDSSRIQPTIKDLIAAIKKELDVLHEPELALLSRNRRASLRRARNRATLYVYKNQLSQAAILHVDFTGLRHIPEPKEEIISKYYDLIERHSRARGFKIYGGEGGDDAFSIIFHHFESALCCTEEIKKEFEGDLFFRSTHCDIKFGLSFTKLDEHQKEEAIVRCWGLAKDCCEYKSENYRNRGHLIVDEDSIELLRTIADPSVTQRIVEIKDEKLSDGKKLFYISRIEPIKY
jgi:hypothetical protein